MPITTFHDHYEALIDSLVENKVLSVLFLDCDEMSLFEEWYGRKTYLESLKFLQDVLIKMQGSMVRDDDILVSNHPNNNQFFIFLSHKRTQQKLLVTTLKTVAKRINDFINEKIVNSNLKEVKNSVKTYIGYALVLYNPIIGKDMMLSNLMEDAKKMSEYHKYQILKENKENIQELIYKEEITTVYQPIVNIQDQTTMGYEALTRGPKNTEYENPYLLFKAANDVNLVLELDRICRKHAFLNAKSIPEGTKIFINCLPSSLDDPEFKGMNLETLLKEIKILPSSVVLEITEREAVNNYSNFKETLSYYTDLGIAVAIDDTGTGYSNFESLIELKPDYVKIDISLVRNVNKNLIKQEVITALVNICKSIDSIIIAEGVETDEEFNTIKKLNVTHAQGYLFARPSFPFPMVDQKYLK